MTDVTSATSTTSTNIAAGQKSLNTTYTEFLTLLTTQLKNQDPSQPLDTNAFTQQLVSMTGVQQQLLSNQLLQQIAGQTQDGGVASSVGLIGKTATAASSNAVLSGGSAQWSYNLAADAGSATLTVSDSSGKAVWSGPASALTAGDHGFSWNGKDFSGAQRADGGTYTLSVTASDAAGQAVTSAVSVSGVVGSVSQANGQTQVKIGPTPVPLSTITSVTSQ